MKSPFDTFGVNSWAPGQDGGSTVLGALKSLARTLSGISANATSVATAVSTIESRGLSVWAAPTATKVAEALVGTTGTVSAGTFQYRASGPLGARDLGALTGATPAAGLPWNGMAFWDGTQFRGILVWAWTGDTINSLGDIVAGARPVTTPASIFSPVTGDNLFRRVRPLVIDSGGNIVLDGSDGATGYQFSSAQNPTSNGYYSTSFFSQDDGVWGIRPGASIDGDTPGPSLTTGSYGFQNFNGSEPVSSYWWGGTAQTSTTFVGVVFSA